MHHLVSIFYQTISNEVLTSSICCLSRVHLLLWKYTHTKEAFIRLHTKEVIQPIDPTTNPAPENKHHKWHPNAYCKYYQGNGHQTSVCLALRNTLQDMVDSGRLLIPPTAKVSNNSNPLGIVSIARGA